MPTSLASVVPTPLLDVQRGNFVVAPDAGLLIWTAVAFALWLGVAALIGRAAARRGQSRTLFITVSLVFSPVVAVVLLFVLRPQPQPLRH